MDDDGIDAIFLNFVTPFFVDTLGVAREIADANRRSCKPIVATVMTEKKGWAETLKVIRDGGVPTYDMPETGAKVLTSMGCYAAFLKRPTETPASFTDVDTLRARSIIEATGKAGRAFLSADHGYELLSCYGIDVAPYKSAGTVDECVGAADEIGYPVVLKVDAETIVHKTDRCGVILDIHDRDSLRKHAEEMALRFADASPRFLVQQQMGEGCEVIVGAKAAEGLGHIVMFGLGGIYVEVLKDVSFKLTPVTATEARDMIESLRAHQLLTGVRGRAGVDITALEQIIQRVSQMLTENPEIRELDINPVFALERGAKAADIRVML
jgi:acetyltransferase